MMFLFLLTIVTLASCDRTVETTNGPVKGISLSPKKIEAFLGIPYAEPPVGPLRFAKPVPKSFSEEIYIANELPPSCVQFPFGNSYFFPDSNAKMSEDCLYLNLWVPEGGSDVKPIMLFIHGGGFMTGSTNMKVYDGANLAEHGDVIVATINYRVGTLGFFSGYEEDATGNMGLYDQVMAIQWVKENAKYFNGDPDNIVLFGESAGGFSVSLHLISPLSKGLFKRAILQSGTVISPLYKNNDILHMTSQYLASLLGCTADKNESVNNDPESVIDCMKALPSEKFSQVEGFLFKSGGMMFPRVGDSFLPKDTVDSYKNGNFKDTELLLGVTSNEGSLFLAFQLDDMLGKFGEKGEQLDFNETFARQYLHRVTQQSGDSINEVMEEYFDRVRKNPGYTYKQATADFIGDLFISCGVVFQADYYSLSNNPVYFYVFDYRADSTPWAEWMGVLHFDELQYVFGNPVHQEFTEYEKEFSRDIMDMWVAFAKTGNPNIPGGVEWPRYTYQDPKHLVISKKDRVALRPDNNRCESWRKIFGTEIKEDTIEKLKKTA